MWQQIRLPDDIFAITQLIDLFRARVLLFVFLSRERRTNHLWKWLRYCGWRFSVSRSSLRDIKLLSYGCIHTRPHLTPLKTGYGCMPFQLSSFIRLFLLLFFQPFPFFSFSFFLSHLTFFCFLLLMSQGIIHVTAAGNICRIDCKVQFVPRGCYRDRGVRLHSLSFKRKQIWLKYLKGELKVEVNLAL